MLKKFRAFQEAKNLYDACKRERIPPFLQYQLMRASASVALNIAEGSGKRTPQDQKRFYSIALGSLRECESIIALENIRDPAILSSMDQLGAMLYIMTAGRRPQRTGTEAGSAGERATESETETAGETVLKPAQS